MLKKKPFKSKLAQHRQHRQHRLHKAAVKRARVAKAERARFLAAVKANQPTEAGARMTGQLVKRVRAAKTASFLQRYRIVFSL